MYNGIPLAASAVAAVGGGYSFFKTHRNESLRIVGLSLLVNAVSSLAMAFITRNEVVEVENPSRKTQHKAWRLIIPLNMLTGFVCSSILAASSRLGPGTKKIRAEILAVPILLGTALSLYRGYFEYRRIGPTSASDEYVFCCSTWSFPNNRVSVSLHSTLEVAYNVQVATTLLIAGLALDARFSLSERIARSIWRVQTNRSLLLGAI